MGDACVFHLILRSFPTPTNQEHFPCKVRWGDYCAEGKNKCWLFVIALIFPSLIVKLPTADPLEIRHL